MARINEAQYKAALIKRLRDLRDSVRNDSFEGTWVKPSDSRVYELRAIKRILKITKTQAPLDV